MNEIIVWDFVGVILTEERKGSEKKTVSVPHCPAEIPHGMAWDRNRNFVVRGLRLTALAMHGPEVY
jgi:hypothetical protein